MYRTTFILILVIKFITSSLAKCNNALCGICSQSPSKSVIDKNVKEIEDTFVFLKTHKTGSSTVSSILHRFAINKNLTCFVPPLDLDSFKWDFSYAMIKSAIDVQMSMSGIVSYDCFTSHSILDSYMFSNIVKNEKTNFITIIRHPVERFISAWYFYDPPNRSETISSKMTLEKYVEECYNTYLNNAEKGDEWIDNETSQWNFNGMSVELIGNLDGNIDDRINCVKDEESKWSVMILEKIDESLIILRKKFGWNNHDIFYHSMNINKGRRTVTNEIRRKIEVLAHSDMKFYHAAVAKHAENLELFFHSTGNAKSEVALFQEKNREQNEFCDYLEENDMDMDTECKLMRMTDKQWITVLNPYEFNSDILLGEDTTSLTSTNFSNTHTIADGKVSRKEAMYNNLETHLPLIASCSAKIISESGNEIIKRELKCEAFHYPRRPESQSLELELKFFDSQIDACLDLPFVDQTVKTEEIKPNGDISTIKKNLFTNYIALVPRGGCSFVKKAFAVQSSLGYNALIIGNNNIENQTEVFSPALGDDEFAKSISIPAVMINLEDYEILQNHINDNSDNKRKNKVTVNIILQNPDTRGKDSIERMTL